MATISASVVRHTARQLRATAVLPPTCFPARSRTFRTVVAAVADGSSEDENSVQQAGNRQVERRDPTTMMPRDEREADRWLAPFGGSNLYMPGFGRIGSFLRNIDDEVNTMMQFLQGFTDMPSELGKISQAALQVDIHDKKDVIELKADVPGLSKDDIKVRVLPGNILNISGKRVVEESGGGDAGGSRRYERRFMGAFQRSFSLPENVDANGISAKVENGTLDIRMPKLEESDSAGTKDIPID